MSNVLNVGKFDTNSVDELLTWRNAAIQRNKMRDHATNAMLKEIDRMEKKYIKDTKWIAELNRAMSKKLFAYKKQNQ